MGNPMSITMFARISMMKTTRRMIQMILSRVVSFQSLLFFQQKQMIRPMMMSGHASFEPKLATGTKAERNCKKA